jgi:hypothetical protein
MSAISQFKTPSSQETHLATASLHPQEGSELMALHRTQGFFSNWPILSSQNNYPFSIINHVPTT